MEAIEQVDIVHQIFEGESDLASQTLGEEDLLRLRGLIGKELTTQQFALNDVMFARSEMQAYRGVEVSSNPELLERRTDVGRTIVRLQLLLNQVISLRGEMSGGQAPD